MAGRDDFVDKCRPVVRPFLLEDGNENEVELVEQGPLLAQRLFGARALDDELDNEVSDSYRSKPVRPGC
jgi:hypothetical protein